MAGTFPDRHYFYHYLKAHQFEQLEEFLELFRKNGEIEEGRFSLATFRGMDDFKSNLPVPCSDSNERWSSIFSDASYGFVLKDYGQLIAAIGFEPHPNAFLVSQLQGVIGMQENLADLRWSWALLNVVGIFAKENEVPEVWVLPGNRNKYDDVSKSSRARTI